MRIYGFIAVLFFSNPAFSQGELQIDQQMTIPQQMVEQYFGNGHPYPIEIQQAVHVLRERLKLNDGVRLVVTFANAQAEDEKYEVTVQFCRSEGLFPCFRTIPRFSFSRKQTGVRVQDYYLLTMGANSLNHLADVLPTKITGVVEFKKVTWSSKALFSRVAFDLNKVLYGGETVTVFDQNNQMTVNLNFQN